MVKLCVHLVTAKCPRCASSLVTVSMLRMRGENLSNSLALRCIFFFSSRRRHTRCLSDWSSDVCSSDLRADRGRCVVSRLVRAQLLGLVRTRATWGFVLAALTFVAARVGMVLGSAGQVEIGRASCRERVEIGVDVGWLQEIDCVCTHEER